MNQIVSGIFSGGFSATLIVIVYQYVRDRRPNKAKAEVAEKTVATTVDAAQLENMDKRLGLVEKAHDQEVESLQATIRNMQQRLDFAMNRIVNLENRVQFEDSRYRAAAKYIRGLRAWIAHNVPGLDPPAIPRELEVDFDDGLSGH